MQQKRLAKIGIATTAFAFATLLSFGWSDQRGVSLSVESAQARTGHKSTPVKATAVPRRQYRVAYAQGRDPVGVGAAAGAAVATGAIGFAGDPYAATGWGGDYYASSPWGEYACRPPAAGCKPSASKDWWH